MYESLLTSRRHARKKSCFKKPCNLIIKKYMMDNSYVTSESFITIIQGSALVFSVVFFFTGGVTCYKIHRQKSVKNVNFLPYLTTCLNTFLWFVYGVLKRDRLLMVVNGTGCSLQILYIFVFMQNCDNKQVYLKKVVTMVSLCFVVLVYAQFDNRFFDTLQTLGWLACIVTVVMFGSPLSTLREVMLTQNPETISFPLSIMTCLVTASWFVYGCLKKDPFIKVPNMLGFLLGVAQVIVIFVYRKPTPKRDNTLV